MRRLFVPEDGFTVIEVLVAVLILAIGIGAMLGTLDASRRLTLVNERQTSLAHRATLELERVKSLPYSQIGLTGSSSAWSTTSGSYYYVGGQTGACPNTAGGAAPTYQSDQSPGSTASPEPLVINGCSYTIGGTTSTFSGGTVAPVTAWSDGRLSGFVYDFVTWSNDASCSQTSGSICPSSDDYKRVTVVVTLTGATQPSHPAIVSAFVADPNAHPSGAPSNSTQNPLSNPTTTCQNSQGQTVSCSNTLNGTPLQYFLTDCSYSGTCTTPPCTGNTLHNTLFAVSGVAAAPDTLSSALPSGNCVSGSGTPLPPCYATDLGCGTPVGGLPITPSVPPLTGSTCGSPPSTNAKAHSWVTPQIPAGTTLNLTGAGSMTTYLQSAGSASVTATLCVGVYVVPGGVLGSLTGNLLASPIGAAAAATVTATAGAPTPVSFNFTVGSGSTVASTSTNVVRLEVVVWLVSSGSTGMNLLYDQAQYASQFTLITQ